MPRSLRHNKLSTDQPPEVTVLPGASEADVTLFSSGAVVANASTIRRAKRIALCVEQTCGARWDEMPIPVVIEELFSTFCTFSTVFFVHLTSCILCAAADQKAVIRSALADIESKTCVRFNIL